MNIPLGARLWLEGSRVIQLKHIIKCAHIWACANTKELEVSALPPFLV